MKKTFRLSLMAAATVACLASSGTVRARTHDVAFTYRMGAGFPGDVNRTHPASILPGLMNTTTPVLLYGNPVLVDTVTNSIREVLVGDTAVTTIAGVLVRPYPTQQTTGGMSASIGAAVPPTSGVVDVLQDGFIMVRCNNFAAQQPTKAGAVFIWIAASTGAHVQGGFESVASSGNTIAITNARFNGPTDAAGVTELQVWQA